MRYLLGLALLVGAAAQSTPLPNLSLSCPDENAINKPVDACHGYIMAIGTGVFILREALSIPEGLAVSGNGKGDTILVADNGVEMAVSSFGNARVSDLTIINTQLGLNASCQPQVP